MFDALSDRLEAVFSRLRSGGKLSEQQVDEAMREIRLALLEADVNFKVVRTFVSRIKERAVGAEVSEALNPGQQVVKIVHEELVRILGEQSAPLDLGSASPAVIMLAGLQGSGKTTAAGKLAKLLKKKGRSPMLVACDLQRPAAMRIQVVADQLIFTLGLVDAQCAACDHVQPIFELEFQIAIRRAEHDRFQLRTGILQREVDVAGIPHPAIRDFALDPELAES